MRAVILLAAVFGMVSSMMTGCPREEDISPCMCIEDDLDVDLTLTCTEQGTTPEVLTRVMRAIPPQNTLAIELAWLKLGKLPSRYFENVNVKRLEIWNSDLDGLTSEGEDGKPLAGLENTLEELIIAGSFSNDKASLKLSFSHLNRLQILQLSDNTIPELGDDWFKYGPSSLSQLILSNNGINKIGNRAFEGLSGLEYLFMDGNRFGFVRRSMLPNPANKLVKLLLDNNALTDLPEDMFSQMPSLTSVSFRNNGLRKLPKETFEPVWEQLENLDLRGNSLECDSHLEWMSQVGTRARVFGNCSSPPEKEGVELKDLVKVLH